MMRVHLVNVGERNGGDLLMAMAAAAALQARLGPLELTVNGRRVADARTLRIQGATRSIYRRLTSPASFWRARRKVPFESLLHAGDLVLDVNGYRHGGIWPDTNLIRDVEGAAAVRAADARLVLLPKSYGPFDERSGALFSDLAKAADLVYARDAESLNFCSAWDGAVRLRPDFTIGVAAADRASGGKATPGHVVIVPNFKLVERAIFSDVAAYADFIAACVKYLAAQRREARVLFHQAMDVRQLHQPLRSRGVACDFHDDPRRAKAALRDAKLVISSRYHGMIGALTQGTPCLVLGWSHKYSGFLENYSVGPRLVIETATVAALAERLDWFDRAESRAAIAESLGAGNAGLRRESDEMWDEVAALRSGG